MQVYRRRAVPLSWGSGFQDVVEFVGASPNQSAMIVLQSSPSSGHRDEGVKDSSFVSPCDHCSTQVLILDNSCLLNVSVAKKGPRLVPGCSKHIGVSFGRGGHLAKQTCVRHFPIAHPQYPSGRKCFDHASFHFHSYILSLI
jgi:hypothetical protein